MPFWQVWGRLCHRNYSKDLHSWNRNPWSSVIWCWFYPWAHTVHREWGEVWECRKPSRLKVEGRRFARKNPQVEYSKALCLFQRPAGSCTRTCPRSLRSACWEFMGCLGGLMCLRWNKCFLWYQQRLYQFIMNVFESWGPWRTFIRLLFECMDRIDRTRTLDCWSLLLTCGNDRRRGRSRCFAPLTSLEVLGMCSPELRLQILVFIVELRYFQIPVRRVSAWW